MAVPVWTWILVVPFTMLLIPVSASNPNEVWSSSHSKPCSLISVLGAIAIMEKILPSAPWMVQDSPAWRMRAVVSSSQIQTGPSV